MTSEDQLASAIDKCSPGRHVTELWSDWVHMVAIAISNAVAYREDREKLYQAYASKYTPDEIERMKQAFALYVDLVDANPYQDLLGNTYMHLDMGNSKTGQFFTPYNIASLTASLGIEAVVDEIKRNGYGALNDPACGGGAMLIAGADALRQHGVNYQQSAFFVGQDLNATTALMCYIQLSVLGCAGYVRVGDTLRDPPTGRTIFAPQEEGVWTMPGYYDAVWAGRRTSILMDDAIKEVQHGRARECYPAHK